ncbi:hypothetical protein TUM20985_26720 [Mycobacterium antarcticum]|nr:hypothetical protein TUM20985_26720 [Mycolicibacterium sp. TUM20985]GLP75429.1 hypothetical protein TUM20983_25390 [Mycolicibacterium sp. TUM20983]GLP84307.1 hypothetical protein TUM20984_57270 [Mycolicibacterium sp. TUM20984]
MLSGADAFGRTEPPDRRGILWAAEITGPFEGGPRTRTVCGATRFSGVSCRGRFGGV